VLGKVAVPCWADDRGRVVWPGTGRLVRLGWLRIRGRIRGRRVGRPPAGL